MNGSKQAAGRMAMAALAATLMAPAGALAQEADFTFNVPLEISNLDPSVRGLGVTCAVRSLLGRTIGSAFLRVQVTEDGGAARDTAIVHVNVNETPASLVGVTYRCQLMFEDGRDLRIVDDPESLPADARPARGAPFVPSVQGPVVDVGGAFRPPPIPGFPQ